MIMIMIRISEFTLPLYLQAGPTTWPYACMKGDGTVRECFEKPPTPWKGRLKLKGHFMFCRRPSGIGLDKQYEAGKAALIKA